MLSEILVLALISTKVFVLSQSPQGSDSPSSDVPNGPDDDLESPPSLGGDYDQEETTTLEPPSTDWNDYLQGMPQLPGITWDENHTPNDPATNSIEDYTPAQQQQGGNGSQWFFWFIMVIVLIGVIGIVVLWVFIGVDLRKDGRKRTENREKYIIDKHKKLDGVGMDKGSAERAANQTTSTDRSDESVRSSKTSIPSDDGSAKEEANTSKTTSKADPKGANPVPKDSKP